MKREYERVREYDFDNLDDEQKNPFNNQRLGEKDLARDYETDNSYNSKRGLI